MKTAECSELRNSERLIEAHHARIRFAASHGWLVWNGKKWEVDAPAVKEMSKEVLRVLYRDATDTIKQASKKAAELATLAAEGDAESADQVEGKVRHAKASVALAKWATKSQSVRGISGMMNLAESDGRVKLDPKLLDAQPELLNVDNGTIDLRSGELRPHDPADLLTLISPVKYDPGADQSWWRGFLADITDKDQAMMEELQTLAGYSLLGGPNREELFVFMIGMPGSGKGTVIEALRGAMGEYAKAISFDTFIRRAQPTDLRPDLARLNGPRMVSANEVDKDRHLDEGLLSTFTGRDTVHARTLHKEGLDFTPQFTPWFSMNRAPKVDPDPDGSGFWRRLHALDFRHRFGVNANPEIKAYCTDPARGGPAILRWAVEGAIGYLAKPGAIPKSPRSRAIADKYRDDNDPLSDFIREMLVVSVLHGDRETWVPRATVLAAYEKFCKAEGIRQPLSAKSVAKVLRSPVYGCVEGYKRGGGGHVWYGLRERTISDDVADESTAERAANQAGGE